MSQILIKFSQTEYNIISYHIIANYTGNMFEKDSTKTTASLLYRAGICRLSEYNYKVQQTSYSAGSCLNGQIKFWNYEYLKMLHILIKFLHPKI